MAVSGSICILYFIILKIVDPGRLFDFTFFWLFCGIVCWAGFIFKKQLNLYIHAIFSASIIRRRVVLVMLALFTAGNTAILWYIVTPPPESARKPAYLLVLGGGISKKGHPSRTLAARLDRAILYAEARPNVMVIVSGGQAVEMPWSEALAMETYLVDKGGLSRERILKEDTSLDTIQNLAYCRTLILDRDGMLSPVAILTSDSHLKRALLLARRSGYTECSGEAAATPLLFIPNNYTREIAAYWKLGIRTMLFGK